MLRIFKRIEVQNGWRLPFWRCWWRYIVLPVGRIDRCEPLGWTSISLFGIAFFWMHDLTPEQHKIAVANGQKFLAAMKKHDPEAFREPR